MAIGISGVPDFGHCSCLYELAELDGDLFGRHACPLEGAGVFCSGRRHNRGERRKRPEETG